MRCITDEVEQLESTLHGLKAADISHTMPVLNSPLLCIHVSIVMLAFVTILTTYLGVNYILGGMHAYA